jgi:glycosyltransferase involved in cell wall biosynthesis
MMKKLKSLSVFFPAYNEEANIKKTVERAVSTLPKIAHQWEVIVVDDGSTDKTGVITKKMIKKEKRIRMITHTPNRGYGAALKSGLYNSEYDWIAYTDSDGQFDFGEIDRFLEFTSQADLILGYRLKRSDSFYREVLQKILSLANFVLFGLKVKDVDCGFKMLKKEVVDRIGPLITESAMTETEFIVKAKKAGFKMIEVGVTHFPRAGGAQTGGKLKIISKAIVEGLSLWWLLLKEKKK